MSELIKIKNLVKQYPKKRSGFFQKKEVFTAVDHVDLTIKRGEILGLIGESGSGKSTLGRLIMGLVDPSGGSILYEGTEISGLPFKERMPYYRKMQMIFQDSTSSLNPRKTIGEQIVTPMLRLGAASTKEEAEREAVYLLQKVGLKQEHFHRYPHEFSGGQRQRIGIARALALKPEFLVLDEPTSALDVSIQAQILNLLLDLQEEFNLTYLFIGHNLSVIRFFCDRVAVLYKGKIVETASSEELYEKPYHPVSEMLLDSVLTLEQKEIGGSAREIERELAVEGASGGCVFAGKCAYVKEPCLQSHPPAVRGGEAEGQRSVACYYPLTQQKEMVEVGQR